MYDKSYNRINNCTGQTPRRSACMLTVKVYMRKKCGLCDDAVVTLDFLSRKLPIEIKQIDIEKDDELHEKYQLVIPVVEVEGKEIAYGIVSSVDLEQKIRAYLDK